MESDELYFLTKSPEVTKKNLYMNQKVEIRAFKSFSFFVIIKEMLLKVIKAINQLDKALKANIILSDKINK